MKRILVILLVFIILPQQRAGAQEIDHWETAIKPGSICHYLVPSSQPDPEWTLPGYNDASWLSGPGGVGYGDEDDMTTINPAISVFCRYSFEVADPSVILELILDMDFDDGFVAYLNGHEVARFLMGTEGSLTWWNQEADGLHEADRYLGNLPMRFTLEREQLSILRTGENLLAIEVHNESTGSSDLSSNVYLHAGISTAQGFFSTPPYWFLPPFRFDSTLLPLMVIETGGQAIPDEPRITADMGLIWNGTGYYNHPDDPLNNYDGKISIEIRGESSQYFYNKKSYSIETQTPEGENNNVSLLGLPEENDYVLYGPYGDKSLIRNVITYRLYESFGHYAPRTRFIELILNGDYLGLYVLTEKIKQDRNRVDIARINPMDTVGDELTGGYLMRVDKTTYMDPSEYWTSPVTPPVPGYFPITYQFFDPEYEELNAPQRQYMKNYLILVERALSGEHFRDPVRGYRGYMDIPSFVDLMILNEFVKDVDGFRLSHYFYKEKDSDGGKLVNGPPWDYNLTFGNSDYTEDVHLTTNWTYTLTNTIYWWARAMEDQWLRNEVYCRWDELYSSLLSQQWINTLIDNLISEMGDAVRRNFERWPILGIYQWPNSYVGQTYADEEAYLRSWISNRLLWIDGEWGGQCVPAAIHGEEVFPAVPELKVYPNPSDLSRTFFSLNLGGPATLQIRLYDMSGSLVHQSQMECSGREAAHTLPDLSSLPDGIYLLEV
ncbi:MAG: CotH kinase family protein, partial [Bacteroidales bacterium]